MGEIVCNLLTIHMKHREEKKKQQQKKYRIKKEDGLLKIELEK